MTTSTSTSTSPPIHIHIHNLRLKAQVEHVIAQLQQRVDTLLSDHQSLVQIHLQRLVDVQEELILAISRASAFLAQCDAAVTSFSDTNNPNRELIHKANKKIMEENLRSLQEASDAAKTLSGKVINPAKGEKRNSSWEVKIISRYL